MGSYISMGFVYNKTNEKKINVEFRKLIDYLVLKDGKINNMKLSKDIDGEEWIEESSVKDHQMDMITEYYYGQLNVTCSIIGGNSLEVVIHIEKEDDYFGFLLDVCESELVKVSCLEELNYITERIITFIVDFYNISVFNYAFCDNEAKIEYSPKDFRALNNDIYSIVIIPSVEKQGKLNVIKSNWNIDGLTNRT